MAIQAEARAAQADEQLARVAQAEAKGLRDQALKLRRDVLDRFSKYTDTVELLAPIRPLVPDEKKSAPTSTDAPPAEKAPAEPPK